MRGLPRIWGQGCAPNHLGYILANVLERIGGAFLTHCVMSLACGRLSSKETPQTQPSPKADLQPSPNNKTFRTLNCGLQNPGSSSGWAELRVVTELNVVTGQGYRSRPTSTQLGFAISLLFNLGSKTKPLTASVSSYENEGTFLPTFWFAVRHIILFES